MCGVVGFTTRSLTPTELEGLIRLMRESRIRGLHAFGFAVEVADTLSVERFNSLEACVSSLAGMLPYVGLPLRFVGHTRYSTSGPPEDVANNQPLYKRGVALAFNGVLDMRSKEEREAAYGRSFATDNDGELFLDALDEGGEAEDALRSLRGSFAGLVLRRGELLALRNPDRPLWRSGPYFYSTASIGLRALGESGRQLEPYRAVWA